MKTGPLLVAWAVLMWAGVAWAQSGADVVKAKGCLNCHDNDKKKVGPAYKELSAKYRDDKGAEARLVTKLKEGKDHPKIAASDAELKAAVGYALSQK